MARSARPAASPLLELQQRRQPSSEQLRLCVGHPNRLRLEALSCRHYGGVCMVRAHRVSLHSLLVILTGLLAACGYSAPSITTNTNVPIVSALTLNPASVQGGKTSTGTITINLAAPAGGIPIAVRVNNVSVNVNNTPSTVVAIVMVPAGATTAKFVLSTQQVGSPLAVDVSITLNGVSIETTFTVTPVTPLAVTGLTFNPTTVASGTTAQGIVTISAPAFLSGQPVNLISSSP